MSIINDNPTLRFTMPVGNVLVKAIWDYDISKLLQITPDGAVSGSDYLDSLPYGTVIFTVPSIINGIAVKTIAKSAFHECIAIKSITLPDSLQGIEEGAFASCTFLSSIVIPNDVISIQKNAFYRCFSLTSITLPNDLQNISDFAFDSCELLSSITIPNSVTSIGNEVFYGCELLTEINIDKPFNSIIGAPWGAPNATVNWLR